MSIVLNLTQPNCQSSSVELSRVGRHAFGFSQRQNKLAVRHGVRRSCFLSLPFNPPDNDACTALKAASRRVKSENIGNIVQHSSAFIDIINIPSFLTRRHTALLVTWRWRISLRVGVQGESTPIPWHCRSRDNYELLNFVLHVVNNNEYYSMKGYTD